MNVSLFINPRGYALTKIPLTDPALYEFRLNLDDPLEFRTRSGTILQPNRYFKTDMRTGPRVIDLIEPKDRYLLSDIMHDSGYVFGGFWIDGGFVTYSREEVDLLRRDQFLPAEGCGKTMRYLDYWACRWFGRGCWQKGDRAKKV